MKLPIVGCVSLLLGHKADILSRPVDVCEGTTDLLCKRGHFRFLDSNRTSDAVTV